MLWLNEEEVGFIVTANNKNGPLYLTGTITSGRFDASTDINDAIVVYVEEAGDGLSKLYFMNGDTKTYFVMADKAAGGSLTTDVDAATVFEWNSEINSFMAEEDSNSRAFGAQNTSTYNNLSCYDVPSNSANEIYSWAQFIPA